MQHHTETRARARSHYIHKFGTELPAGVRSTEAMQIAKLDWNVSLCELETVANGHPSQPVTMARATRRDDTGAVLGVVGTQYRVLQNERAFGAFDRWVDAGLMSYQVAGEFANGSRTWILAKLAVDDLAIGPGDIVQPYVTLINGHDGATASRVISSACRTVCSNALHSMYLAAIISRAFRHVGDVGTKADVAIAEMDSVRTAAAKQAAIYRALAEANLPTKTIARDDAVLDYLAAVWQTNAAELAEKQRAIDVADLFDGAGMGADLTTSQGTWWGMYQALAEYVTHRGGRGDEGRIESAMAGGRANVLRRGIAVAWAMGRDRIEPVQLAGMGTDAIEATIAASMGATA